MSKLRFNWWPFALNMIRDYPDRSKHKEFLQRQELKEYAAVHSAVEQTMAMPDGSCRISVINLTLWKETRTVSGAAMQLHITERTAQRYRWQFVVLVGKSYGFLTEEEYKLLLEKEYGNKKRNPSD